MTFTVIKHAHKCGPKPALPIGSEIKCDECGRVYRRSMIGWIEPDMLAPDVPEELIDG